MNLCSFSLKALKSMKYFLNKKQIEFIYKKYLIQAFKFKIHAIKYF